MSSLTRVEGAHKKRLTMVFRSSIGPVCPSDTQIFPSSRDDSPRNGTAVRKPQRANSSKAFQNATMKGQSRASGSPGETVYVLFAYLLSHPIFRSRLHCVREPRPLYWLRGEFCPLLFLLFLLLLLFFLFFFLFLFFWEGRALSDPL